MTSPSPFTLPPHSPVPSSTHLPPAPSIIHPSALPGSAARMDESTRSPHCRHAPVARVPLLHSKHHTHSLPPEPSPPSGSPALSLPQTQHLSPSCAVFPEDVPASSAPSNPSHSPSPHVQTFPASMPSAAAHHDFFSWRLQPTPPDISIPAPVRVLQDDFEAAHLTGLGAWYPLSRGLHSQVGLSVFADQAAISARARQGASVEARAALARRQSAPKLCTYGRPASVRERDVRLSAGLRRKTFVQEPCEWDDEGHGRNAFQDSVDEEEENFPWENEDDGCDTPLWRRQITLGAGCRQTADGEQGGTVASNGDITAEQAARGVDVQGILWENLPFSREDYRATRLRESSRRDSNDFKEGLRDVLNEPRKGARYYDFFKNTRQVKCSIVHFQLRNLAWATSKHDVFVMHDAAIVHWDAAAKRKSQVLDLSGSGTAAASGLGMVQISTMIARDDLVIAGGFYGEMIAKNVRTGTIMHNKRITFDENAITNAIDMFDETIMTSNNDCYVRCFDMRTFQKKASFEFGKPVNHATRQPGGNMVVVAGDEYSIQVIGGDRGERIAVLHGHDEFSFATGWHPNGRLFATGSQDKTCRVWDVRNMSQSCSVLGARTGAVRSLRFSSCGRFLLMAEPRDFVHIFDVNRGAFDSCQEVDIFGEIAGIALTPGAESLYIAVSDRSYSSLMEYHRKTDSLMSELIV